MRELDLPEHTIVDWLNFMRDICATWFEHNPVQIDGPGMSKCINFLCSLLGIVVEIDETVAVRRKYGVGRVVKNNVWLFGGVERDNSSNCFLTALEGQKRNAQTLLPLIQQFIKPGSGIHSDFWAAYNTISCLPEGYLHKKVNHTENFVDSECGAHKQLKDSGI